MNLDENVNSYDEPLTYVGDRWVSEGEDDGATVTGATCAAEGDESIVVSPIASRPSQGFYLTRKKTGECFEIAGDPFYVGKSKDASYQLRNTDTISRMHACFHVVGDECWIEDNRSLNGTVVDGTKLQPYCRVRLSSGAVICLSDEEFLLEVRAL